jgi:hypothetical protein
MYTFEKTQDFIDPTDVISRQHVIPADVKKYAVTWQLSFPNPAGRGRGNVPSLADIYEQLTRTGLSIVERGINPEPEPNGGMNPVFTEIGLPAGASQTRIKFDTATDTRLRALKTRIDGGEFEIVSGPGYTRKVTQISLISLAVNLMQIAIACENIPVDQPKQRKQRRGAMSPA